jgi:hypothetical protein
MNHRRHNVFENQSTKKKDIMTTLNINEMTTEELAVIEKQIRERKSAAKRSQKHAAFEPHYSEYRKAVITAKEANDNKKRLLITLKSLGFGKKMVTAPATGATTKKTVGKKK